MRTITMFLLTIAISIGVTSAASAQIVLQRATIGQAGGTASNGTTTMNYTVSQAATGRASNGQTVGQFGFWNAKTGIASVRNDNRAGSIEAVTLYPNPAQSDIEVTVSLATTGSLELALYDDAGQLVKTIYSGNTLSGTSKIHVDVSDLTSGAYFVAAKMPSAMLQTRLNVVR